MTIYICQIDRIPCYFCFFQDGEKQMKDDQDEDDRKKREEEDEKRKEEGGDEEEEDMEEPPMDEVRLTLFAIKGLLCDLVLYLLPARTSIG